MEQDLLVWISVIVVPAIDAYTVHTVHPIAAAAAVAALVGGALAAGVVLVMGVVLRVAALLLLLLMPFFLTLLPLFLSLLLAKARSSLHHVLPEGLHPRQNTHVLIPPAPPPRIVAVLVPGPTIRAHAAHTLVVVIPSISARRQVLLAAAMVLPIELPRAGRRRGRRVQGEQGVLGIAFVKGPCRHVGCRGRALQRGQVLVVVAVVWQVALGRGQVQSGHIGLHNCWLPTRVLVFVLVRHSQGRHLVGARLSPVLRFLL